MKQDVNSGTGRDVKKPNIPVRFGTKYLRLLLVLGITCSAISGCSKKKKEEASAAPAPVAAPTDTIPADDPTPLAAPIVSLPIGNPYLSNDITLTISGACTSGAIVSLAGDFETTTTCAEAGFSFSVSKPADGTYNFSVSQHSNALNSSTAVTVQWQRDTLAPNAPTFSAPASNPFTSSDTNFSLQGTCDEGNTVSLTGDLTDSTICTAGVFSFAISKSGDGTYNFLVTQSDQVANISGAANFQWVRNSTLPATPIINSPGGSPFYSNADAITLAGTCVTGNAVNLSGATTDSAVCANSTFSFNVNKTSDNSYSFQVSQIDAVNGLASGNATMIWERDTVVPSVPTISAPGLSPYHSNNNSVIISGICESNATVNLTGSASLSTTCSNSTFTFNINNTSDGTYTYTLTETDMAGNVSASTNQVWERDSSAPTAPTITLPASNPLISNANVITISGACMANSMVTLSGDASGSIACSGLAYTFNITKNTDFSYAFSVVQADQAGNSSSAANFTWVRDTSVPLAPTIVSPGANPYTSADTTFSVSGACENGATVTLAGDLTDSTTCNAGAYSLGLTKNADATYNFTFSQTDVAGNASGTTSFQWVRNSSIPSTPTVGSPAVTPVNSNLSSLAISGACTDTYTVELSGSDTQSTTCSLSAYSFTVNNSSDGTYNYTVKQKNGSNIYSAGATVQWVRDTIDPTVPTITTPAVSPFVSNGNSATISGACETNATVNLIGDSAQSTTCSGSTYSFSVSKSTDASYNFSIGQTDLAGNNSGLTNLIWVRDTVAPNAPTIANPSSSPFTSSATTLAISGACDTGNTVSLQEYTTVGRITPNGSPSTVLCTAGAYNLSFTNSIEATYYLAVKQIDSANNSSVESNLDWTRNANFMSTPTISRNSVEVTAPIYTNSGSIVLNVTCTQGANNQVLTSASSVAPGSTISCASQASGDFTISEASDGTYFYDFWQEDTVTPNNSAIVTVQWVRDTSVPSAPVITAPASSPYVAPGNLILSGTCEIGATVNLAGDATDAAPCTSGLFSFTVVKSVDATYTLNLTQTDQASNTSAAATMSWVRDSNSVPPPTIASPASNVTNNSSTITLSGICNDGYVLSLSGFGDGTITVPAGSATQTCNGGSYSYTVTKSTDGILNFSIKQTFNSVDSSLVTRSWTRDTVLPIVTISSGPAAVSLQFLATFVFSADESVSMFECKLDGGVYGSCTSPYSPPTIANGVHTLYIRATDVATNIAAAATYSWDQQAFNAIAIYHLDTANITLNSSSYTGTYANTLTTTGTPALISTGKFGQGRGLSSGNNYYVADNDSLDTMTKALSIEGYWQGWAGITSAATNTTWTLISKNGNSSGNFGWELLLVKTAGNNTNNTKCVLQLKLTSLASTTPTIITGGTVFKCGANTTSWNYFAATWSAAGSGSVKFFGTPTGSTTFTNFGSGTFGTTTTLLATNAVNVTLGAGGSGTAFPGGIDDVRISQTARTITVVPTAAFTAD
jgi:hypothetical protein